MENSRTWDFSRDVLKVVECDTAEDEGPTRVRLHDGEGSFLDAELLTTETLGPAISDEDAHAASAFAVAGEDDGSIDREAALATECDRLAADVKRYRMELEFSCAKLARTKNEVEGF